MGRIQAAWTVVMGEDHNEIDQADLDQFAAETLAGIDKRRWPTTKKPRVVQSQDHETALVVPTTLGLAMAGLGHEPAAGSTVVNGSFGGRHQTFKGGAKIFDFCRNARETQILTKFFQYS